MGEAQCQRCSGHSSWLKSDPPSEKTAGPRRSMLSNIVLIASLNATITVGAINTGMFTILLPHIGKDLHMSSGVLLWYVFHCPQLCTNELINNPSRPALVYSSASPAPSHPSAHLN